MTTQARETVGPRSTLAGKTLAIVLAATLGLVLGICLPLRAVVLSRFAAVERELGEHDLERARNALTDDVDALGAMARDYAVWDETYAFAGGEPGTYVATNFADTTFSMNRIGLVAIVDLHGHPVWSDGFDLHARRRRAAPAVSELVRGDDDVLLAHLRPEDVSVAGIVRTSEGLVLIGSHAILTSTGAGPTRGTLLLGRAFDAQEIERLAGLVRLELGVVPLDGERPADVRAHASEIEALAADDVLVSAIDEDRLGAYALLRDARGEPCAVLRVVSPREVYAQGRADANMIAGSVAGASLLFGLLVLFLLQRVVVRRVTQLGAEVGAVGAAGDHALRVSVRGDDELATLGRDVNAMLASLEALNSDLEVERAKAERLLRNILPEAIATRLKDREETIADAFPEVSVLFADIVGFTDLSAKVSAPELVVMLNDIFSRFDALAERHGLEKIKTIGDAYMIVAGLPLPRADHAEAIARMGLDMQEAIEAFNAAHGTTLAIRIGINTGPVVAGVIGTKKFIYDLWGDAVNIASRMESSGVPGRVQVSESTYEKLRGTMELEPRGTIQVKGKGEMSTWFLVPRSKAPPR